MKFSRRKFIRTSSLAVAAMAGSFARPIRAFSQSATTPNWVERPMRWAQLTLVEDDPGKYDPKFWLDYFRRTRSDAACLSAGGCVAYYPTRVPLHYRSRWMTGDPFGELVAGCRKLGMAVVARTDPHATYDEAMEAHPDWIAVDASGKKRRHWASPEMWVTCGLGPYNFEFMTEVHREIMSLYQVDGIFINRWDGSGMCYCEHCRKNFQTATGLDLPRTTDPRNPAARAYLLWRQNRLFDLWQLWEKAVQKINPNSCVIPNTGGGALSSLDMRKIGDSAAMLAADRQGRRGLTPPWANGKNGKEYRATMGRKPCIGIFSVGPEEPYRWKDSVQSDAEIRIWVADGIANGLRPWFSKFAGTLHDPRWLKVVENIFQWHHSAEKYLRNERSLARVGVLYSQQTAWFYGGDRAREKVEDHTLGFYHALVEARIPFEMVHDRSLSESELAPFKTLILPNIAALSNDQCAQLGSFVQRGGGIVATYETSLYNEWGERRADFGLSELFGVSFKNIEGPVRNSYLETHRLPGSERFHPLLAGLEDAPRIINSAWRIEVKPNQNFPQPPLTLIPSHPDLPMEKVFPRVPHTDIPAVYLRELSGPGGNLAGRGRVVYFPWDVDRIFWEVLAVDHGRLLRNAIEWAGNEENPVEVPGPGLIDITIWEQKDSMTVHLVNLTNPMAMKGPFRELIPVGEQKVKVRLPRSRRLRGVKLLVSGKKPHVTRKGSWIEVIVPSVLDHEVVALDLG